MNRRERHVINDTMQRKEWRKHMTKTGLKKIKLTTILKEFIQFRFIIRKEIRERRDSKRSRLKQSVYCLICLDERMAENFKK